MIWCVGLMKKLMWTDILPFPLCPYYFLKSHGCTAQINYCTFHWSHKLLATLFTLGVIFLTFYWERRDEILSYIVIEDETWVSHVEKAVFIVEAYCLSNKKFKRITSTRKIAYTASWNRHGVLLVEFTTQETTINSYIYCETLRKVWHGIQNKRRRIVAFFYFTIMFNLDLAWTTSSYILRSICVLIMMVNCKMK